MQAFVSVPRGVSGGQVTQTPEDPGETRPRHTAGKSAGWWLGASFPLHMRLSVGTGLQEQVSQETESGSCQLLASSVQ